MTRKQADFIFKYFLLKRKVVTKMFKDGYLNEYEESHGVLGDEQVPGTYACFADLIMERLLLDFLPLMEKHTELKLVPTYSYARLYKKGDILKRHKDRPECEISTTLNLGGDPWPLFIDPTGKDSVIDETTNLVKANAPKGKKILMKPGDMLVYRGFDLEHWREPFEGDVCAQVFLHYNDATSKTINKYDSRPFIGLPSWFKGRK